MSDHVPAADVFPAFSYLRIGRDGRVWVLPYQEPGAERQDWMGFDRDGGFLCHLEHDHPRLTIYEFGADYWLGVQADQLGVETVVVYRLTTPAGWLRRGLQRGLTEPATGTSHERRPIGAFARWLGSPRSPSGRRER